MKRITSGYYLPTARISIRHGTSYGLSALLNRHMDQKRLTWR